MSSGARAVVLLPFLLVFACLGGAACASSGTLASAVDAGDGGTGDGGGADDAADVLAPPPIQRSQGEGQLLPQRQACAFDAGAWPAQTIGTDYPLGSDIPINHVIVIMQENRSFDHYLGRLVAQGYYKDGEIDVPPAGWSNLDADGGTVVPHPDNEHCYGVDHSWQAQHDDYDDGKNDHFVLQNEPDGQRAFFYEDDSVIPFYYALASTFGVGDRYFCSVLSSTWPNRFFLMGATSRGIGDNSFMTDDTQDHPVPQVFSLLEAGGHTWKDYTDGPHMVEFYPWFGFQSETRSHLGDVRCDLLSDIQNGTLPDVSFVMGDEVTEDSDEGPSDLPGIGGQVVETIIRTLFASPSWKDTAVFITYDENGGIADHVVPAPACKPDDSQPHDGNGNPLPGAFDTTGFRVPFIVVSPYARAHFVSHAIYDHTSLTRFIEARFGLPALTARDANATPPFEMFDFQSPPFATPPNITARTPVDPTVLAQCKQSLAPLSCK
jgi:phospholipase C